MIFRFKIIENPRLDSFHQNFVWGVFLLLATTLIFVQSEQVDQDVKLNETSVTNSTIEDEKILEAVQNGLNYGYYLPNGGFYSCPNPNNQNVHPALSSSSCYFVDPNERQNLYKRQLFHQISPFGFLNNNNNNPGQIRLIENQLAPPPLPDFLIGIETGGHPSISKIDGISDKNDLARLLRGTGSFECDFQSQSLQSTSQNRQRQRPSSSSPTNQRIQGFGSYGCAFKGIRRLSETFLYGFGVFSCNFTRILDSTQIKLVQKIQKEKHQNQSISLNQDIKFSPPRVFQGTGQYQCTFNFKELKDDDDDGQSPGGGGGIGNGPIPIGGIPGFGQRPPQIPPLFKPNLEQVVLPNVKQKEGFIQGTGQFQCIVQGPFIGFQIIESVGYYRCIFRGARKTRGFIEGLGYFQLIYQKPEQLQTFFQMVGQYQCNFQSVRHFHGFVSSMGHPLVDTPGVVVPVGPVPISNPPPFTGQIFENPFPPELRVDQNSNSTFNNNNNNTSGSIPLPPPPHPAPPPPLILPILPPGIAVKTSYLDFIVEYFSGLGRPDSRNGQPGSFQLLGNYQHDIDGLQQHPNFGSVQLLELYNMELDLVDLGQDDQTNFGQRDYISQQGQIRYSFQEGNPIHPVPYQRDSDLIQMTGQLGYNFQLQSTPDEEFFLYLGRYDYESEGPDVPADPDHDHDFIQCVGSYSFHYPQNPNPNDTNAQSHIQTIITYQYDHARTVADFLQIVALFDQNYRGFDEADKMFLKLLATYQRGFFGGTSEEFVQFIGTFTYSLKGMGTDAGFFQLYTFYDQMLKHPQASNGYLQMLLQYAFNYQGPGENIGTLQIQLQYQYNFPEFPEISTVQANHGYFQILGKFKIDLLWLKIEQVPSYLQVVVIFQCNFVEGSIHTEHMCFTQLYCIYQSNVMGIADNPNAYGRIVGQYYGEL